jgi:hypothetical protein
MFQNKNKNYCMRLALAILLQYGENCVEYGSLYSGEAVGTGSRTAGDTAACRQYCHQANTCRAFAFSKRNYTCCSSNYYLLLWQING